MLDLLRRPGRWLTLTPRQIERATAWFKRHGDLAVVLCQPMPGLRTLIAVPAGALRQSPPRLALLASGGSLPVVLMLAGAGFVCGRQWQAAADCLG
jgi:membrane protein DedA with SNARE-associated domain